MYSRPTVPASRSGTRHRAIAGSVAPINMVGGVSTIVQTMARSATADVPGSAIVRYTCWR